MNKNIILILITFLITGFGSVELTAQANKKKPPVEKEKKVTETAKDAKSAKKADDTKDNPLQAIRKRTGPRLDERLKSLPMDQLRLVEDFLIKLAEGQS